MARGGRMMGVPVPEALVQVGHAMAMFGALAAIAVAGGARAATPVPAGDLTSQTWTAAGSPYVVAGDVRVLDGHTLVIEAGTLVQVADDAPAGPGDLSYYSEIVVEGALVIEGTASSRVVLSADASGSFWGGVLVRPGGELTARHARVEQAEASVTSQAAGTAVSLEHVELVYAGWGSTFRATTGTPVLTDVVTNGALRFSGDAAPTLTRVLVEGDGPDALTFENSAPVDVLIDGLTIDGKRGGIRITSEGSQTKRYTIQNSAIALRASDSYRCVDWSGSGVVVAGSRNLNVGCSATNLAGSSTKLDPLLGPDHQLTRWSPGRFYGTLGQDIGARPYDGTPTTRNMGWIWEDATIGPGTIDLGGSITVKPGATLTIAPGTTLRMPKVDGMTQHATNGPFVQVDGTLIAAGTDDAGIRMWNADPVDPGTWDGLVVSASSTDTVIDHVRIEDAITGVRWQSAEGALLSHVEILGGTKGVQLEGSGHHVIEGLDVRGATTGISVEGSTTLELWDSLVVGGNGKRPVSITSIAVTEHLVEQSTLVDVYQDACIVATLPAQASLLVRNSILGAIGGVSYGISIASGTATLEYSVFDAAGAMTGAGTKVVGPGVVPENPILTTDTRFPTEYSPARFAGDLGQHVGAFPYTGDPAPGLYGTLWEDTTLGPGLVEVEGDLVVASGVTLTLRPGTTLDFVADLAQNYMGGAELIARGTLVASGTSSQPVVIDGGYGLLLDEGSESSALRHLRLQYQNTALRIDVAGVMPLRDMVIEDPSAVGLDVRGGEVVAERLTIRKAGSSSLPSYGVSLGANTSGTFRRSAILGGNNRAFYLANGADLLLERCTTAANTGAFWIDGGVTGDESVVVRDSILDAASSVPSGVVLEHVGVPGATSLTGATAWRYGALMVDENGLDGRLTSRSPYRFAASDGTALGAYPYDGAQTVPLMGVVWDDLVVPAGDHPWTGDLVVPVGSTLTLSAGAHLVAQVLRDDLFMNALSGTEILVDGTLRVEGEPFDPVTLYRGYQVHLRPGSTGSTIAHLAMTLPGTGLRHQTTDPTPVTGLTLTDPTSAGVLVVAGHPVLDGLKVTKAPDAVSVDAGAHVTLTNCVLQDGDLAASTALALRGDATASLSHCFVSELPTGFKVVDGQATVRDTVFRAVNDLAAFTGTGSVDISYSLVASTPTDVSFGAGMLVGANPLVGADLSPLDGSPLIDAGDPDGTTAWDIGGRPRPFDGDGDGSIRPDIGPWEVNDLVAGIVTAIVDTQSHEDGSTATVNVSLAAPPYSVVTVLVGASDATEAIADVTEIVFSPATWDVPLPVTLTGVDDLVDDGDQPYTLTLDASASPDPLYHDLDPVVVSGLSNADDDASALLVAPTSGLVTSESGRTATFTVALATQPTATVRLDFLPTDDTEGAISPLAVSFSTSNWNVPRTITVSGVDDGVTDGDQPWQVEIDPLFSADPLYAALSPAYVGVTNLDRVPGVTALPVAATTSEAGGAATISIVLDAPPAAPVTVAVSSTDTSEGTTSASQVQFTAANWSTPKTVTVTGVDDAIDDGDVAYALAVGPITSTDTVYAAIDPPDVALTNTDDDTAAIGVSPTTLTLSESGPGSAAVTVTLGSRPTADVAVAVGSSDPTEGSASPSTVTFTPATWDVPHVVTVTAAADGVDDGDVAWAVTLGPVTSTDATYAAIDPADVAVTTTDADEAAFVVVGGPLQVDEGGTTATATVALGSRPASPVSVALSVSDASEASVSPPSLAFDADDWSTPKTVTVTGLDDGEPDGSVAWTLRVGPASGDGAYAGVALVEVPGLTRDDDSAAIWVDPTSDRVTGEDGTVDTFEVVLGMAPTHDVVVPVATDDPTEGEPDVTELTFTPADWDEPQLVTIVGVDDALTDGSVTYVIEVGPASSDDPLYDGLEAADVVVVNLDDEGPGIDVTPTSGLVVAESGAGTSVSVVLAYPPTAAVHVQFVSDDPTEGVAQPAEATFGPDDWDVPQVVPLAPVDDPFADGDVAFALTVSAISDDPGYDGLLGPTIHAVCTDDEAAAFSVAPTSGLVVDESGTTATFTVVLTAEPLAPVLVEVRASEPSEGTLSQGQLSFDANTWDVPVTVTVTGADDPWDDGDIAWTVELLPAWSEDPAWQQVDAPDVAVTTIDDDTSPAGGDTDDTDDTGEFPIDDTGGDEPTGGCGCQTGAPSPMWVAALALLALRRRYRRP